MKKPPSHVTTLKLILKKGIMSPRLKEAVEAILKAINDKNPPLAYQLSVVKSFITGTLNPKDKVHAFQEDQDANEKSLGESIYSLLDGVHFRLSMAVDSMPSGMMILSSSKDGKTMKTEEMKSVGSHPIIRRIKAERKALYKKYPTTKPAKE